MLFSSGLVREDWLMGSRFADPFESQKNLLEDIRSDTPRQIYCRRYMEAILMAISEGVNVVGCLAWSIMDNLEWASGQFPSLHQDIIHPSILVPLSSLIESTFHHHKLKNTLIPNYRLQRQIRHAIRKLHLRRAALQSQFLRIRRRIQEVRRRSCRACVSSLD